MSIVLGGIRSPVRALALARLADEHAQGSGKCLWIGSRDAVRPLPWRALREQRLDARPLRPDLGDVPWPVVNPFDLDADLCAIWATAVLGRVNLETRAVLQANIEKTLVSVLGTTSWKVPSPVDLWPEIVKQFELGDRPHLDRLIYLSGSQTTLNFVSDLTVICGHPADLADRKWQALLVLLGFISAARRGHFQNTPLLVLEDWLELLPPQVVGWVASVLVDLTMTGKVRLLIATPSPMTLALSSGGNSLLAVSHRILTELVDSSWPTCWPVLSKKSRMGQGLVGVDEVWISLAGAREWHPRAVPSPANIETHDRD